MSTKQNGDDKHSEPHSASLVLGQMVEPETFDAVTVLFSDIVGFTHIASLATPMEIVVFLNDIYTLFDDIAQQFDMYKVATIGDAYMVSSGAPTRNGDRHATEICNLAVALLEGSTHFSLPNLPGEHLQMRAGIHSGPCVAGIVGVKMPRYLLFGETVDIAAKIEANGEPQKIHVSHATKVLTNHADRLRFQETEKIVLKHKNDLITYWLYTE